MKETLCQICQKNLAIIVVSEIDEKGRRKEIAICEECAKKKGILEGGKADLSEFLKVMLKAREKEEQKLICRRCSLSFYEFKKYGKFGCPDCFKAFEEKLLPFIKRMQKVEEEIFHKGKRVSFGFKRGVMLAEIKRLRIELKKAIAEEDYEKAAKIRDVLKQKEGELKKE